MAGTVAARTADPTHPGRPFVVTDASLVWIQWLAVAAMLLDHINWFVFAGGANPRSTPYVWMNDLGRLAFPLFAFAFGLNLARIDGDRLRLARMAFRLLAFGLVAQVPYWVLRGYFWPLNVLWLFGVALLVDQLWSKRGRSLVFGAAAFTTFVVGGAVVEYWWFGLAIALAAAHYGRHRSLSAFAGFVLALLGLTALNANWVTLFAGVLIVALARVQWALPRVPSLLYWIYAGHLWALMSALAVTGWLI